MLTLREREAITVTVELANLLSDIVGDGATREADLSELVFYIHGIQRSIMAQAAARENPDQFRLLGQTMVD